MTEFSRGGQNVEATLSGFESVPHGLLFLHSKTLSEAALPRALAEVPHVGNLSLVREFPAEFSRRD
jgi:hypothetical protein